ncbi:MAG: PhzF family phenazine biosynthesis protein [Gemmatimonadaceae bacterium]|nr:PhzF family phenazine biosynthesis protein [Gemmatimonadaceae bacterium]
MTETLSRWAAFTTDPAGGNPAGVWIGDALPDTHTMQRIARDVGYSETVFVAPSHGLERTVRYYSPEMEIPFCGHATIAAGVQLGVRDGAGSYTLHTQVGAVPVTVQAVVGQMQASLTSVTPQWERPSSKLVQAVLQLLGWNADELEPDLPPARAYAGAWHLVLVVRNRATLDRLHYDFEAMRRLMHEHSLTTLQLVWPESATVFHSRNPFPVGGVVEDPATGAAAAALAGYLRDAGLILAPTALTIHQGVSMGRPSLLRVIVPVVGGVVVQGTAVPLPSVDALAVQSR